MPPTESTSTFPRRIYVVAGMHRAGTSVVARALQALGIDLGPRLMSADIRMNARGFFEDLDLVRINDALLAACNADWKNSALLDDVDWRRAEFDWLTADARTFLVSRLEACGVFGCKDPRIPRLLPFWQAQCAREQIVDHYVVAVRHPLSVMASLTTRDGLDVRRSGWLWLTHLVCAMHYTAGRPRVVVDYDRMLAAPNVELDRMRAALAIPRAADTNGAIDAFVGDFLAPELRHAEHTAADLATSGLPAAVIDAWQLANGAARDEIAPAEVQARFHALFHELCRVSPLLGYAGHVERQADDVPRLQGELAWATSSLDEATAFAESMRVPLAEAVTYADDLELTVQRKDEDLRKMQQVLDQVRERVLGRMVLREIQRRR
ncbi:MAG: hypothetical protein ABI777_03845 [Betaproteobacteria bacterium]